MNIVIFTHEESGAPGRALVNGVSACRLPRPVQQVRTTADLKAHLKGSGEKRGQEVLVLLAETRERMAELIRLGDLLEDSRLILIVPDQAPDTLSAAHRLFPRFVATMADQYKDLCSVIGRMVSGTGSR